MGDAHRPAGVRPRSRFEVFKRDGFQCQYCGRRVPDVTLECDHVIPRAKGGRDNIDNLITSCSECNRGKSDELLGQVILPTPRAQLVKLAQERQRQMAAYYAYEEEINAWMEARVDEAESYWYQECEGDAAYRFRPTLRKYIEKLGLTDVKKAMSIAARNGNVAYLIGILRNAAREGGVGKGRSQQ